MEHEKIALKNINLEECASWGHTEYSLEYHMPYLEKKTGLTMKDPEFGTKANQVFQKHFHWLTNDGLIDWEKTGRVTDMGHASYALDGSDQHSSAVSPFTTLEEVWEFDAVEEYGLPDFDEQVAAYEKIAQHQKEHVPDAPITGGYYKSLMSGAIATFGWDMLLMGWSEPEKMAKVFDSFKRRTLFHMKAWAQTSVEVVIQHDDFVWTSGPFMSPDTYREFVIPHYKELWKPLHDAGKKLLFCSDGNFMEFAEDVAECGADGFIFEPITDFEFMVDHFGSSHCLVGSAVDCRDLTFEKWDIVKNDIDRTFEALKRCKGAIVAVGNHLAPNIPDHMLDKYFDYLLPKLQKD